LSHGRQHPASKEGGPFVFSLVYTTIHAISWGSFESDINFWKCWLQHGPNYNPDEIDFYEPLIFGKLDLKKNCIQQRGRKKDNLKPFDKKMVLIPLNFSQYHWNLLAVLLNLDAFERRGWATSVSAKKSPMPCMLFFDSSYVPSCNWGGPVEVQLQPSTHTNFSFSGENPGCLGGRSVWGVN
jgi:hypothetical protein